MLLVTNRFPIVEIIGSIYLVLKDKSVVKGFVLTNYHTRIG